MDSISEFISISKAAEEIKEDRAWLTGHLAGLGIEPIRIGSSLVIRRSDLKRVKKRRGKRKPA